MPRTALVADTVKLRILSLGAGVQSTTLALMAARGAQGLWNWSGPVEVAA